MASYIVPSLRKKLQPTTIIESDFPSFGSATVQRQAQKQGFKQIIIDRIEKDLIDDTPSLAETDPHKMNAAELHAKGWAILSLKRCNVKYQS